jgi:mono/diheme cytochrome c family protein
MRGIALASLFVCVIAGGQSVSAQQVSAQKLNETQALGQRLYTQHCGVCHTKPTIVSPYYGPALSKENINNNEDALREFIKLGTERMPGFQYTLEPRQIDAIVQYLKTVEPRTDAGPSAPRPAARGNERELD